MEEGRRKRGDILWEGRCKGERGGFCKVQKKKKKKKKKKKNRGKKDWWSWWG